MHKELIKKNIQNIIESKLQDIITIGDTIYKHPETGFKEFKTAAFIAEKFQSLGFQVTQLTDIPGIIATYNTQKEGPHIAVLGEMDAVINTNHKDADTITGAVHACGHHVQIAVMLGTAMAFALSEIKDELCGKISFMALPAEEFIEVEYRQMLRKKGVIKYFSGKSEYIYRGLFDDIDLCMMMHVSSNDTHQVYFPQGTNGFLTKAIKYIGKASHAGASPDQGINALYAANIGLMAANCLRETFKEQDTIRFHPIITKGGDVVNVIPEEVHIEAQLRAKSIEAVLNTNQKINRAFIGGAVAMGAQVEIQDLPGYMPFKPSKDLDAICKNIVKSLVGEQAYTNEVHGTYSLDIGDLSTLMPTLHPFVKGAKGAMHSSNYQIDDQKTAYGLSTKILALTALELLWKDANLVQSVLQNYQPVFKSKQAYFDFINRMFSQITYDEKKINRHI